MTRWYVEVAPLEGDAQAESYCVEATQWQQALKHVRQVRGDSGALSRFAIEMLPTGYRATDPTMRLRY
ncbi:MAG: hypothetical protein FJ104_07575, partial [Deltaproteobacteria bacterium]|nr:hypothetical protein [Deltaproteobacteria bacterium]